MHKSRIYVDTSVFGGSFDKEFQKWSNPFINVIKKGIYVCVVSDITLKELKDAPQSIIALYHSIPKEHI